MCDFCKDGRVFYYRQRKTTGIMYEAVADCPYCPQKPIGKCILTIITRDSWDKYCQKRREQKGTNKRSKIIIDFTEPEVY